MQAIEVSEKTSESRLKKSKKGNELFTPDCTAYFWCYKHNPKTRIFLNPFTYARNSKTNSLRMKLFFSILLSVLLTNSFGQSRLTYNDSTMTQLKVVADSVNLDFRSSELDTHHVSPPQTKGHFVSITKEFVEDAYKAIASGVSWNDFKTQFPTSNLKVAEEKYRMSDRKQVWAHYLRTPIWVNECEMLEKYNSLA
ncbi:MAG: hypothetical protein ACI85I_000505 [Arenicella sp.]|jgi:hypothetical protein